MDLAISGNSYIIDTAVTIGKKSVMSDCIHEMKYFIDSYL